MPTLSVNTKESIKTALAMVISYAIALSMGWENTMWAGFAVIFISLATLGQSINKAALRMFGTLVAAFVALLLISLFSQDRWLFLIFLSLWVSFCSYKMGGETHQYFWHVCGFACVIICMDGGADPVNAFEIAMLRTQQTALGILVYSLIAIFLWPQRSSVNFDKSTINLALLQQELFTSSMKLLHVGAIDAVEKKENCASNISKLIASEKQGLNQFYQLFDAAITDSYRISSNLKKWLYYREKVTSLSYKLALLRDSYTEIQGLELSSLIPNITAFNQNIEKRLIYVLNRLKNEEPNCTYHSIELTLDDTLIADLPHFEKAAFAVFIERLREINVVSADLYKAIDNIRDETQTSFPLKQTKTSMFLFNRERLFGSVRVFIAMWIANFSVIYIPDMPGGLALLSMLVPFAMLLANMPQLPVEKLFIPVAFSIIYTSLIYMFLMPQLTSYLEVGSLLFIVTFFVCYCFSSPQLMLMKAFSMALFLAITDISNAQVYSFFAMSTTALMFALVFMILSAIAYIPVSIHPDKVFTRLISRYFSSGKALLNLVGNDHVQPIMPFKNNQSWKKAFYLQELNALPNVLSAWARFMGKNLLIDDGQSLTALIASLQAINLRFQELLIIQQYTYSESFMNELLVDIQGWQDRVEAVFYQLSTQPDSGDSKLLQKNLEDIMISFEQKIQELFNRKESEKLNDSQREHFYRLLGAYRGLSEALVQYGTKSESIQWSLWKEERF